METLPSKPTRHGLFIARVVVVNTFLLILGFAYSNITRHSQVKRIEDAATLARAKTEALEQQLLEYMDRTVQRWDLLATANPQLAVPRTIEPQPPGKRALSPDETFHIRKPTPIPTPAPAPKTRVHTVIKYRRAPTPKPWFHW